MPKQINSKNLELSLGLVNNFFVIHPNANSANAKDIVENLLDQSMSLVLATWSCFENQDGQVVNKFNNDLIANLLLDIKVKLQLIEKALPLAFEDSQNKKAVTL
ncbi:hypothetical protein ACFODO_01355 [Acinetobacter sichuanensis]|uniref:Uncharacterized protein n=1 Tax=Acinetobacter sichuanensis TaxID=2136183 RepID=A0A371YTU4_9GAMM|nr:hypothetical protein [Acinetobacter sichuanensis]RFC84883.1 hypothetical protein C9E89_002885 [Acinetobacter sichuanensis]